MGDSPIYPLRELQPQLLLPGFGVGNLSGIRSARPIASSTAAEDNLHDSATDIDPPTFNSDPAIEKDTGEG